MNMRKQETKQEAAQMERRERVLSRKLARELSLEELNRIHGGVSSLPTGSGNPCEGGTDCDVYNA
jgi:hypothetical protein